MFIFDGFIRSRISPRPKSGVFYVSILRVCRVVTPTDGTVFDRPAPIPIALLTQGFFIS
jgi:hypothetical protein